MRLYVLACVLLLCGCALANAASVQLYGLEDCFDGATVGGQSCRMKVKAAYQALQVAQVKHGMKEKTCQFGSSPTADTLVAQLRDVLRFAASQNPKAPIAVLAVGALTSPVSCPNGVAKEVGGLLAGQALNLCKLPPPSGGFDVCLAYIGGLSDALVLASGSGGAEDFICLAPNTAPPSQKEAANLLIEEIKRDQNSQQIRPGAELMAEALSKKYPCH
jgi:hypothetical protein